MGKRTRKSASAPNEESQPKVEGWWNNALPTPEFLPKEVGFNYYHLLDDGILKRAIFDGEETIQVHFKAEWDQLTDTNGKELRKSPSEPEEGTLSIPLSVAKKIRAFMEEKGYTVSDIQGKILKLQRTGKDKATRYPTVELLLAEDYYEE